ncbi:hypothetical protein [Nitrobacter sp. JJSN]|uniref:hypothetical protein n=1 Tax=Nitrobacter sp. JJSN TaxID=3453033 RepID=UPI003F75ECA1
MDNLTKPLSKVGRGEAKSVTPVEVEKPRPLAVKRREREKADADKIQKILADQLDGYSVECGRSLLYKIEIETSGRLSYDAAGAPMRGQHAFQTDLLITKGPTPLVAIELKSGTFSSHDVITYSAKAARHKKIYPYLRYGFVVVGLNALGRRFVTHNEGFDFAMAVPDRNSLPTDLVALVQRQIASSERLIELLQPGSINVRSYEQNVAIDLQGSTPPIQG